jgi:hypothetical protein
MKRASILAVLLCALGFIVPLGKTSASAAECPAYPSCADNSQCGPDETCVKSPGQGCGTCLSLAI